MAPTQEGVPDACLGDDVMAGFLEAGLAASEQDRATEHLSNCQDCREQLAVLARLEADEPDSYRSLVFDESGQAQGGSGADADELVVGDSLGRYVLLGKVGQGGMGVVYSAFDPELDRRIAVKVIRSEAASTSEESKRRLREEARAMAKLTHPNVVRVYDVGRQGGLVYIAMEYVDGVDLGRYAERNGDDWREVFDACLQAGRGLVAAHEAGLVHRDFKPSNVLCAKDGRVLVVDFGLTRLLQPALGGLDAAKTQGAGTPGYVAPEQATGRESTVRSDQYSFCVTVVECLLGQEPKAPGFDEEPTVSELSSEEIAVSSSRERSGASPPRRLETLLRKGMAQSPERRHTSMHSLLGALEDVVSRGRRLRVLLAGLASVGAVGLLMFFLGTRRSKPVVVCGDSATPVRMVWNQARESSLSTSLEASPYRAQAGHFLTSIDEAAGGLALEHEAACKATYVRQTQSAEFYDRQVLCLASQLTSLEFIVEMVEGGGSVETAQFALAKIASPKDCVPSESALNTRPPPSDPAARAIMKEVDRALADATLLARGDDSSLALNATIRAVSLAKSSGYGPSLARAYLANSEVLAGLERFDGARSAAESARDAAAESRDTLVLVRVLLQLAEQAASDEDNPSKAEAYVGTARSLALGTTLPGYYQAALSRTSAVVGHIAKKPAEALADSASGLAQLAEATEEATKPRGMELRESLLSLRASAYFDTGAFDDALEGYEEIAKLKERRLGPTHSGLSATYANLATIQFKLGKLEEARTTLGKAHKVLESPDASRSVLSRCLNLEGLILNRLSKTDEAIATYRRALKVQTEVYGQAHRIVWATKSNLANVLVEKEEWEEAIALQEAHLAWARTRDTSGAASIKAQINLANTLSLGEEIAENFTRAATVISEVLAVMDAGDRRRINALSVRGHALFRLGKNGESATAYDAAIALADTTENTRDSLKGYLRLRLGESLWRMGEKKRGLATARRSLEIYRGVAGKEATVAELETWIAERE